MSLHVFASFVTPFGTAANNRGDNQGGNITPLQKLYWRGEPHTTVSAEAIRFAFRRRLKEDGLPCNRHWAEHPSDIPPKVMEQLIKAYKGEVKTPCGFFLDPDFAWYRDATATGYADDDLLGFMSAEAGREEAEASNETVNEAEVPSETVGEAEAGTDDEAESGTKKKTKGKKKPKGTNYIRRAVLEVTRAISLTPWAGDVTFTVASTGATPSAQKKGSNPVPYGTELHATRYQYGIALTPERLRDPSRAAKALEALGHLGTVAGNHGRFLFDFSPDSIVIRLTDDPAPRLLYCFETADDGKNVIAPTLFKRIEGGDIDPKELILGGTFAADAAVTELKVKGASVHANGVKAAVAEAVSRINAQLKIKG